MLALLILALVAGDSVGSTPRPVAIEQRLADRFHLQVGDTIRLSPAADSAGPVFVIGAIYQPRADPATALRRDYELRLHLPDLATLLGAADRVDRFGVAIAPGAAPDSVADLLNRAAFGYRAYPSRTIAEESSRTFRVVSRFHRAIGIISIGASAVFLLCIMLLKVEERRLDAAMMRMIGVRRRTIFGALVIEACLVALLGSFAGWGLAAAAGAIVNAYYQRRFETTLIFSHLSPDIVWTGIALSLGLGVGAGVLAALRLIRVPPLTLWRRGR
ncbi:MAG: ABC transporter permease [Gemmatimonadota bacterium]